MRNKKEFTGGDTSRGEVRAVHIQNAVWLEWTDLLKEDSNPKSPQEITALLSQFGVGPENDTNTSNTKHCI